MVGAIAVAAPARHGCDAQHLSHVSCYKANCEHPAAVVDETAAQSHKVASNRCALDAFEGPGDSLTKKNCTG